MMVRLPEREGLRLVEVEVELQGRQKVVEEEGPPRVSCCCSKQSELLGRLSMAGHQVAGEGEGPV